MKIHEILDFISDDTVDFVLSEKISAKEITNLTLMKIQNNKEMRQHKKFSLKKFAIILSSAFLTAIIGSTTAFAISGAENMNAFLSKIAGIFTIFSIGEISDFDAFSNISSDFTDENGNIFITKSNGATVTAKNAIFDGHTLILNLLIEAPENVEFKHLKDGDFYTIYDVDSTSKMFPDFPYGYSGGDLETKEGQKLYKVFENEKGKLEIILYYFFDLEKGQKAAPKTFHFEGIWANEITENVNATSENDRFFYKETKILSGDFNIPLQNINKSDEKLFDTDLGEVSITSLGYYYHYHKYFTYEQITMFLDKTYSITLFDGTVVKDSDGDGFWDEIVDIKNVKNFVIGDKIFAEKS